MNEMSTREYWDRKQAEMDSSIANAKEHAASPQGRIESLSRQIEACRYDQTDNGADHHDEIATLQAEIAKIKAERAEAEESQFWAEWTREATIERRAAWNRWAIANNPSAAQAAAQQRKQGWLIWMLKRAIEKYEL